MFDELKDPDLRSTVYTAVMSVMQIAKASQLLPVSKVGSGIE